MAKYYELYQQALDAGDEKAADKYMAEYLGYAEMDETMGDKFYGDKA